ncbi:MAG: hypothetical protein M3143_04825 [Actinomycetota bacterium]|nr:hypothetical protein [Actinomycetota bacterium]
MRYKTLVGYRTDVTSHLVPGLGTHRSDKLEPEHVEKLYGDDPVRVLGWHGAPRAPDLAAR